MCSSELKNVTQARIWICRRLPQKKIERGHAPCLCQIGSSRYDSPKAGGLAPGGLGTTKGRKAVCISPVSPLDRNPNPKDKPNLHLKNHHDRLFMIDLEAAQNSLEFYQTANGSVKCYDTSSGRALHQEHQRQRWIRKVRESLIKRKSSITNEEKATRPQHAEEKLQGMN